MESLRDTVAAARAGDRAAFAALFERNVPRLIAFLRARVGGVITDKESVLDLAQSVCREALVDLGEFEMRSEAEFRNWLFVRAVRKVANRHRFLHRERRDVAREVGVDLSDEDAAGVVEVYATAFSPSRHASAREEIARLENALAQLPDAQREAIALTRVGELSYADAAEQTGRTESALRGLVMRGLARLAAILEENEQP